MADQERTAPLCVVKGCRNVSALIDAATSRFWRIEGYYCSDCFTALLHGEQREVDPARLAVLPGEGRRGDPLAMLP